MDHKKHLGYRRVVRALRAAAERLEASAALDQEKVRVVMNLVQRHVPARVGLISVYRGQPVFEGTPLTARDIDRIIAAFRKGKEIGVKLMQNYAKEAMRRYEAERKDLNDDEGRDFDEGDYAWDVAGNL